MLFGEKTYSFPPATLQEACKACYEKFTLMMRIFFKGKTTHQIFQLPALNNQSNLVNPCIAALNISRLLIKH
jgi:hypothetical protein